MILTYRCRQILEKMVAAKRPLRTVELADALQVSVRAIKYDLDNIRLWLQSLHSPSVRLASKPNRGIWLEGDDTVIGRLLFEVGGNNEQLVFFNHQERVKHIMIHLLTSCNYITIGQLVEKTGVSRNTIIGDLKKAELFLKDWGIVLKSKAGRGTKTIAAETDIRMVLEYLIQGFFSSYDMVYLLQSVTAEDEIPVRITQVIEKFLIAERDITCIYQSVRRIVRSRHESVVLSERDVLGLFIRFCVVLQRIRMGGMLTAVVSDSRQSGWKRLYSLVEQECAVLAQCLAVTIPQCEVQYIAFQWQSSVKPTMPAGNPLAISTVTLELIEAVSRKTGISFHGDAELFDSLLAHLSDRLVKYWSGILDPNPLVTEVIRTYGDMFQSVKAACSNVLNEFEIFLNDADLAYIVLHFQAAYERSFKHYQYRALVVCGTGRGNARLLKARLENEIKTLQVIGCCSVSEVDRALQKYTVDLVISVLPLNISYQTVIIHALPTKQDIELICQTLDGIPRNAPPLAQDFLVRDGSFLERLTLLTTAIQPGALGAAELVSREVISQGFQVAEIVTREFEHCLTAQSAAGLTIHILLMVNRLAFASPYVDFNPGDQLENVQLAAQRERVAAILNEYYPDIPQGEIDAIIRYFS